MLIRYSNDLFFLIFVVILVTVLLLNLLSITIIVDKYTNLFHYHVNHFEIFKSIYFARRFIIIFLGQYFLKNSFVLKQNQEEKMLKENFNLVQKSCKLMHQYINQL